MIEKVARLVDKDAVYEEGFVSFLLSQMSRELADRVVEKIINDGDVICTYKGVEALEYPKTEQVEMRTGIDIQPLVRCKDCKWYGIYEAKKDGTPDERYNPSVCLKGMYAKRRDPNWFCADGEREET